MSTFLQPIIKADYGALLCFLAAKKAGCRRGVLAGGSTLDQAGQPGLGLQHQQGSEWHFKQTEANEFKTQLLIVVDTLKDGGREP